MGAHTLLIVIVNRIRLMEISKTKKQNKPKPLAIPLVVHERNGLDRRNEPVCCGIPITRGLLRNTNDARLLTPSGGCLPVQLEPMAYWADGTIQWLLIDAAVTINAHQRQDWQLVIDPAIPAPPVATPLYISQTDKIIAVETVQRRYVCSKRTFIPFAEIVVDDAHLLATELTATVLEDENGVLYQPQITETVLETSGPLRATIRQSGVFTAHNSPSPITFIARITFYALSDRVDISFTIRNTRAAAHPGNLWDLGDSRSFFIKECTMTIGVTAGHASQRHYADKTGLHPVGSDTHRLLIYQDSSGGVNWNSRTHLNRNGDVPASFKGYRITADGMLAVQGDRISPSMIMAGTDGAVVAAIDKFWQQCPTAIGVDDACITLELFPRHYADLHELQGGEQKTHNITLLFDDHPPTVQMLQTIHHPLTMHSIAQWYCSSGVFSSLVPLNGKLFDRCDKLVMGAVRGKSTFFDRRELIDEYGWRHFGEVYADHEAVQYKQPHRLISHYNNQYDVIYAAQKQFARTGDIRWLRLMDELARHVIDIDIYHTDDDRPEYNHGLFWHTDHYTDAQTCTHRTYSKRTMAERHLSSYGGGPSASHNYTTGLMTYYYMTGNTLAREAFLELIEWTVRLAQGPQSLKAKCKHLIKNLIRFVKETKHGEPIEPYELNGPGRASGNVLNALLDGWVFTGDDQCLALAQSLIKRCVSPRDSFRARHLLCTEMRWMYLVFLLSLVKYLQLKDERGQHDAMFTYAKESLLHYARFIVEHEYPFLSKPEFLEYPNETWGAQDMRKCAVLHYAAKFAESGDERKRFTQRAAEFYESSLNDVYSFPTRTLTRPIVLLMMYGHIHQYFMAQKK